MYCRILCMAALAAVTVAGGCRKAEPTTLTILCGGSFRPPMEEVVSAFEAETGVECELSFGQSEDLLPTVKIGQEGDLFVTHDPYLDYTEEANALLEGVRVGYVAPVLVVPRGNPANVQSLEDLAKDGVNVALPNPDYSTCGEMLFELLETKGIKDKVMENADGAIFRSHSETGNALKMGSRQAGVMWNGTAYEFRDALEIVPTPYEYEETIRVWVMGLSYSDQPSLVRQMLDFCRANGEAVFTEYGYVK